MMQFEIEGATILLPQTQAILVKSENARQSLERDVSGSIKRSHLYPLIDAAARFACSLLIAPQGCDVFDLPREPWMISIGDDLHCAWGPQAFPEAALDAAIAEAEHCVLVASGPDPFPYRVAATAAARDRKNVLLIETLPHQKDAWRERIDVVRKASNPLPTTLCLPIKGAA